MDHRSEFFSYLASERGLSQRTIASYEQDLKRFFLFSSGAFSTDLCVRHLANLRKEGLASSTLCRALVTMRMYEKFLLKEGILLHSAGLLESPKVWQLIPEVLTLEETLKLIEIPGEDSYIDLRDKAILELLYATGMRASEVCFLDVFQVAEGVISVKGKGGKERIIPVAKRSAELLESYLAKRGKSDKKAPLFLSKRGKRLQRSDIWRIVKKWARAAGIEKPVSPHTLRHSYATHLLENGADLRIIQELLGHSHISTTERYTQISKKHLFSTFAKLHPRGGSTK